MDPTAGTSFIPKRSLDSGVSRGGGFGLLTLLAVLFFIASIAAAGGAFLYQQYLTSAIASANDSLTKAEGAYDPAVIQDLLRLDNRITQAKALMQKHVAASAIFSFLSTQTLEKVAFSSFDYSLNSDGSAAITMAGTADSFSTIALQSDQFGNSKLLKDVVFSGITVDPITGHIAFNVAATIDPSLIKYANSLSQNPLTTPVAPAQAPASVSTSTPAQ